VKIKRALLLAIVTVAATAGAALATHTASGLTTLSTWRGTMDRADLSSLVRELGPMHRMDRSDLFVGAVVRLEDQGAGGGRAGTRLVPAARPAVRLADQGAGDPEGRRPFRASARPLVRLGDQGRGDGACRRWAGPAHLFAAWSILRGDGRAWPRPGDQPGQRHRPARPENPGRRRGIDRILSFDTGFDGIAGITGRT